MRLRSRCPFVSRSRVGLLRESRTATLETCRFWEGANSDAPERIASVTLLLDSPYRRNAAREVYTAGIEGEGRGIRFLASRLCESRLYQTGIRFHGSLQFYFAAGLRLRLLPVLACSRLWLDGRPAIENAQIITFG